jgi:cell filamentation protein, protein adenylyltransferase
VTGPDPLTDALTGVPYNLLGATTRQMLDRLEADVSLVALYRLALHPLKGNYDLDHLRAFHADIFGAIYPWAGQIRTEAISKGEPFRPPDDIVAEADDLLQQLATEDHLRGLDLRTFIDRTAHYHARLNAIHPFREGNGRTQRAFLGQLARDAGYEIRWDRLDPRVNVAVSREAMYQDIEPLRVVLADIIQPLRPVYGDHEQTADHLEDRAVHTARLAYRVAQDADQLNSYIDQGYGRLTVTYADARLRATNQVAAIAATQTAQAAYNEGLGHLSALEAEHRQVLAVLHPDANSSRLERQQAGQDLTRLTDQIGTLRADLAGQAAYVAETAQAAGPPQTWSTAQAAARDFTDNWTTHITYARAADLNAAEDLSYLAHWLTGHAIDLSSLADHVRAWAIHPVEAETPIDAIPEPAVKQPQPEQAPPNPEAVPQGPAQRP